MKLSLEKSLLRLNSTDADAGTIVFNKDVSTSIFSKLLFN